MTSILFICTANRYRSPIAEACFRKELIEHKQDSDFDVFSAGTWTSDGFPPMPDAILKARELGFDIRSHRSQVVTDDLIQKADLVLVMERGQKEALQVEFRSSRHKIALLTEVAEGIPNDIGDPMMSSEYAGAGDEICRLIQTGFEKICAKALENSRRR